MTSEESTELRHITERIKEYLCLGGLFNPELMEHDKVRDMILEIRDTILSVLKK